MADPIFIIAISMLFGVLSMLFGIGVAPMMLPYLLLVEGFGIAAAIAGTLIIELFGLSVALVSAMRQKAISYHLAAQILFQTLPAAIIGVLISSTISISTSLLLFSFVLLLFGVLIIHPEHEVLYRRDDPATGYVVSEFGMARNISMVAGTISGLLAGLTGTGIGEANNYVFLKKYRMPGQMATATSIFIVAVTALVAAFGHTLHVLNHTPEVFSRLSGFIALGSLGVVLGVIIGSAMKLDIPDRYRERYAACLFLALGVLGLVALFV